MKKFTKFLSLLLVLVLFVGMIPAPVHAASTTYLEVTRSNAPVRADKFDTGKVVERCSKGEVLKSTGTTWNWKGSKWFKVQLDGSSKTYYIYSGNVKTHKHSYKNTVTFDGVTYKICSCGYINVTAKTQMKLQQGNAIALSASTYGSLALGTGTLDGPLPVGDVIGLVILAYGAYTMTSGQTISSSKAQEIAIELDFGDYLKQNPNTCSEASFRMVSRATGKNLAYKSKTCYNAVQAYALAVGGQDMYTRYQPNALLAASFHPGGCFSDIDKNQPGYYHHYHLGSSHDTKMGGHIFYGKSVNGLLPAG